MEPPLIASASPLCRATIWYHAVGSMVAKYLREALMRRFNAYWRQHAPDVAPTAGSYTDGLRFLGDVAEARRRLGVRDEDLIRAK